MKSGKPGGCGWYCATSKLRTPAQKSASSQSQSERERAYKRVSATAIASVQKMMRCGFVSGSGMPASGSVWEISRPFATALISHKCSRDAEQRCPPAVVPRSARHPTGGNERDRLSLPAAGRNGDRGREDADAH